MSKLELIAADPATVEDDLSNADEAHPHAEAHQPACDGNSSNPGHCDLAGLLYISYLLFHVFNFVFVFGILYFWFFFFACVGKPGDPRHCHVSLVLCHIWISVVKTIKK